VSLRKFLTASRKRINQRGITSGVRSSAYNLYYGLWANSTVLYNPGETFWNRDWDVLLVLDAFRADLMRELADEVGYIVSVGSVWSNASTSGEWMQRNFNEEYENEMSQTAFICGNPHTEIHIENPEAFAVFDETWKYTWDDEIGTIRPEPLNDRAIRTWREENPERMIVHYMQPHFPSIPNPDLGSEIDPTSNMTGEVIWESVWDSLRDGNVTKAEVWAAYRENAQYILSEIELLLNNIDAQKVVLTADHGNSFGTYGIYGHPYGAPIRELREVPWCETSATDSGEYQSSESYKQSASVSTDVEQRLSDLGYT